MVIARGCVILFLLCQSLFVYGQDKPDKEQALEDNHSLVAGVITDEKGDPVTDAKLTLQGPGYYRASTGPEGRYEFLDDIQPGEYRVRIESVDWVGLSDYRSLPKIIVTAEKAITKDFVLPRAAAIRITVVDEEGDPIRGVSVYCRRQDGNRFNREQSASTNAKGVAMLGGLLASAVKYAIGASSKSYAFARALVAATNAGDVAKKTITLQLGQSVTGKVMCNDGKPASGWRLSALPSWWQFNSRPRGVLIGDDGSFEVPHVVDEDYDLMVSIPKGNRMSSSHPVMSNVNLLDMDQPFTVKLDHASAASQNYLTGTIRWIGKPVEGGFSITGYSAQTQGRLRDYIDSKATEFKIGPVSPGIYRVRPESSQIEVMNLRKIKNLDDLDAVKIPNDKPLTIVLRVRGKPHVQGMVVDAQTGKPIKNFRFRFTKVQTLEGPNYTQGDDWNVASSQTGAFQKDVVGPGVYLVSVLADGYALGKSEHVNTTEDPDRELKIELKRGLKLDGMVVDEAGSPISGAKVRALSLASGAMPRVASRFVTDMGAQTTVDGKFAFDNLSDWETFRVDHPDFAFQQVDRVKVNPDASDLWESGDYTANLTDPADLKIELTRGATIRGRVFDQDGQPQAGETLLFQDDDSYGGGDREAGRFGSATSDENGDYDLKHLPTTTVYVSRSEEWNSMGVIRHAVVVNDGGTHTLDFGGTSKLSGCLIANGQPMKNVRLQLSGPDPTFNAMKMYVRTDNDGRFAFHGPPVGDWYLYRELDGSRGDFALIQEVRVPGAVDSAGTGSGSVDLGELRMRIGRLTIKASTKSEIPVAAVFKLLQYNPHQRFGRDAALAVARLDPSDAIAFENVSPGDYELVCYGISDYGFRQRVQIKGEDIDRKVEIALPESDATFVANVTQSDGTPSVGTYEIRSEDGRIHTRLSPKVGEDEKGYRPMKLPAGSYEIRSIMSYRHSQPLATFQLAKGENHEIAIQLQKLDPAPGRAAVVVTDEQGVVIACKIQLVQSDGEWVGEPLTQQTQLPQIFLSAAKGDYTARVDFPGFETATHPVALTAQAQEASNSKIRIQLKRSRTP